MININDKIIGTNLKYGLSKPFCDSFLEAKTMWNDMLGGAAVGMCFILLCTILVYSSQQDTEVPTASAMVEGAPALNRVSWTPSGLHVTVGDDMGKIWVYDVGEVSYTGHFKTFCLTELKSTGNEYHHVTSFPMIIFSWQLSDCHQTPS
jgi:hypothetical protein